MALSTTLDQSAAVRVSFTTQRTRSLRMLLVDRAAEAPAQKHLRVRVARHANRNQNVAVRDRPDGNDDPRVTVLLQRMSDGDVSARDTVWELLHEELRRTAMRRLGRQDPGFTLQATQLVGLAYERIERQVGKEWRDRNHFLAVASVAMRSALVDHVRKKRVDLVHDLPLDALVVEVEERVGDLLAFNEVLSRFQKLDPTMARAVDMRMLGFSMGEIAEVVQMPIRTFERRFAQARAYLHDRLR